MAMSIEQHIDWVADCIAHLDDIGARTIEPREAVLQSLAALRYAGEVVGTPIEALATGVRKLSLNMAAAAKLVAAGALARRDWRENARLFGG